MSIPLEITRLSPSTIQLRQPKASHWEAPFLFLLFGTDRALLLDTGATADPERLPLRETVDGLIADWLRTHPNSEYELVVAHTHAHGDHIAGDGQFAGRPHTSVVGTRVEEVIAFFGLSDWPEHPAVLPLGDRNIDVIPGPGHEPSAVVFFDRESGTLFTGDTVYPGRLYIRDRVAFRATIDRLIAFRDAAGPDLTVLRGCHVEMTSTPGVDYPVGTVDQPDEVPLDLPPEILDDVRLALDAAIDPSGKVVRDRFILSYED
ncbi:MBL fold metallo-hydrolase [Diaminobutyricibacter tongyongensis]|uniref:MBL fold metallo-hydrolase n=1 Tax=Leifsonia tongyongensis TaxID=1268043 RepID=UPI00187792AB|nr:MBL fold metallo-hydrolase [Diaminobutyricibacter tongyongensis]